MTFDRREYESLKNARKAEKINLIHPRLDRLQQAAVEAQKLTGDPKWDVFMQYIQGAIERVRTMAQSHEAALKDPRVVDQSELIAAKIALAECNATMNAWEVVLNLPKEIMDTGEVATDLLKESGLDDTEAA